MKEVYKIINIYNVKSNMYSISNKGNVRNNISKKILKPWKGKNGYMYVSLMTKNGKPRHIGIHVLVTEHFIQKPISTEILVPNHLDFDRTNNNVNNLEWTTYAENNEWNRINGHCKFGEDSPNAKTDSITVHKICKLLEDGYLNKDIIETLKLPNNRYTQSLIKRIRKGTQWKSISDNYNITIKNTLRSSDTDLVESICKMLELKLSIPEMRKCLNIPSSDKSFKNLVTGIRLRRSYKDISYKYKW